MDFAPDVTSVGGGYYERYVSESESTDGEGDASGGGVGQRRHKHTATSSETAPPGYQDFSEIAAAKGNSGGISNSSSNVNGGYQHKQQSSSTSPVSIFTKLAASWSRGGSKGQAETVRSLGTNNPHDDMAGMAWKDVQEGDPTAHPAAIDGGEAEGSSITQVVRYVRVCCVYILSTREEFLDTG